MLIQEFCNDMRQQRSEDRLFESLKQLRRVKDLRSLMDNQGAMAWIPWAAATELLNETPC